MAGFYIDLRACLPYPELLEPHGLWPSATGASHQVMMVAVPMEQVHQRPSQQQVWQERDSVMPVIPQP